MPKYANYIIRISQIVLLIPGYIELKESSELELRKHND